MLNYHIINPQHRQQNDSEFVHYLSLGSYQSPFVFPYLLSFSKIMLTPKKNLPAIKMQPVTKKANKQEFKLCNLVIPLYGELSIDNIAISNSLQSQQKLEQKTNIKFQVSACNSVSNIQYISNNHQKDQNSTFLYLLYKSLEKTQSQSSETMKLQAEYAHQKRFEHLIQQKRVVHHSIQTNSNLIEISLFQLLQDATVQLLKNDIVYLQKGKIILLDEVGDIIEIKNKGNHQGEQNYIGNMVYVAEPLQAQIEAESLVFLVSMKE